MDFYFHFQVWHCYKCSDDAVQSWLQGPPRLPLPQRKHQPGQEICFWHPAHFQGSVRPRPPCTLQLGCGGPDVPLRQRGKLLSFTLPKPGQPAWREAGLQQLPAEPGSAGAAAEAQRGSAMHAVLRGGDRCRVLPLRPYGVLPDLRKSASGETPLLKTFLWKTDEVISLGRRWREDGGRSSLPYKYYVIKLNRKTRHVSHRSLDLRHPSMLWVCSSSYNQSSLIILKFQFLILLWSFKQHLKLCLHSADLIVLHLIS